MTRSIRPGMSVLFLVVLAGVTLVAHAHQDPATVCTRAPPICGDKGRCDQCPNNHFCRYCRKFLRNVGECPAVVRIKRPASRTVGLG